MNQYRGELVFGLDIGTRSIIGTIGYQEDDKFCVVAQRMKEHETRAMLDGQIHDIPKVGAAIRQVTKELEAVAGRELKEVCIAAAGRVLRTITVHTEHEFSTEREVTQEDIYALDSMGVEHAYEEFMKDQSQDMKFYCVGYSVVRYYLNQYPIGNLEGHKAKSMGVDLLATFLPDDVVDGLTRAVEAAGLQVINLTLEPIAAIQVAIPERFRMLNLALVDVGAGTSDISITKDGSVCAYGMLPVAGDSLTETIAQHCLVDFNTAEQIKREYGYKETVEYTDIMGLPQTITSKKIERILKPVIKEIAGKVSDCIKELNGGKGVSAVFVVGGGGIIPGYTQALAKELGIPTERVAVRGEEVMQKIEFLEKNARKDSLLVTPIGICLSFYENNNNFIYVNFNEQRIKLYDNSRLAVVDAAMQADFPHDGLFPRRGAALNYMVNGKARIARGTLGEAAVITVNGKTADIHTQIHANDMIMVREATAGEPADMELSGLPELQDTLQAVVNGDVIVLPKFAMVNGKLQSGYYHIQENDRIEMLNYYTVGQMAAFMDVALEPGTKVYVNHVPAAMETPVYDNFTVEWSLAEYEREQTETEAHPEENKTAKPDAEPAAGDTLSVTTHVIVNGKSIELRGKQKYLFVDIFDYIPFERNKPQGAALVTTVNGAPAQYMEQIHSGDVIEVYWRK